MKKILKTTLILSTIILCAQQVFAESAADIISKADAAFKADRVYSESTMIVYRNGRANPEQRMESYSMDINGENHSLTIYNSPARLKGTAYLMIEDDLWVRFSTTGRVRKMSSSAKKNSAAGSDFSYADMGDGSSGIAEKYSAELSGENEIDGISCHLIELTPAVGEDTPYEKIIAYISSNDYRYIRIEYFDSGAKIKTMNLGDYRRAGNLYYPFRIEMISEVKNSRTVIETSSMEIDSAKVKERVFSTSYLESMR